MPQNVNLAPAGLDETCHTPRTGTGGKGWREGHCAALKRMVKDAKRGLIVLRNPKTPANRHSLSLTHAEAALKLAAANTAAWAGRILPRRCKAARGKEGHNPETGLVPEPRCPSGG